MEEYERLIGQMNELLNGEDIKSNEEIISVRDLRDLLEYKLAGVRDGINNPELFKIKHKNIFASVRIHDIERVEISPFGNSKTIVLKLDLGFNNFDYVKVTRLDDSGEIFISSYYNKRIDYVIKRAIPYLKEIFDEMDKIIELIPSLNHGACSSYITSDELFQFVIIFDSTYDVSFSPLILSYKYDIDDIGDKFWLTKESLNDVFAKNSKTLYGKVGVEVKTLPDYLQNMVGEYLENINQSRRVYTMGEQE